MLINTPKVQYFTLIWNQINLDIQLFNILRSIYNQEIELNKERKGNVCLT